MAGSSNYRADQSYLPRADSVLELSNPGISVAADPRI